MAIATTDQSVNWLIRLAMAVLVVVLIFVIVKALITFATPESTWKQPAIAPVNAQNTASRRTQSFNFATDPFNRDVPIEIETIVVVGEDAPETTLNLKLTGRTTGLNGGPILRTPDNKEATYKIGDEIVPGVTLQAVNSKFIVLDVDGQLQRLTFERDNDTSLIKKTALNDDISKTTGNVKVPAKKRSVSSQPATTIANDVTQLFQNISLRRVMKDGHLTGYSVKANRPGVDLTQLGFSKGDVITNIGGTDLTIGRPDFLALFENAQKNGGIDITVLRNGQIKTIPLGTQ